MPHFSLEGVVEVLRWQPRRTSASPTGGLCPLVAVSPPGSPPGFSIVEQGSRSKTGPMALTARPGLLVQLSVHQDCRIAIRFCSGCPAALQHGPHVSRAHGMRRERLLRSLCPLAFCSLCCICCAILPQVMKDINDKISEAKAAAPPGTNFDATWLKEHSQFSGEIWMGHLRYGTYGGQTKTACHPHVRTSNYKSKTLVRSTLAFPWPCGSPSPPHFSLCQPPYGPLTAAYQPCPNLLQPKITNKRRLGNSFVSLLCLCAQVR